MVATTNEHGGNERLLLPNRSQNAPTTEVGAFRRILPQFLSCWASYLLCWSMGMVMAIPAVVVPAVIGVSRELNPNETISMSADQASWLASILFITQPFGNFVSSILNEALGRKSTILLINVFPLVAWTMLGMSNTPAMAFTAFVALGLGTGLTSAPMTYIGEICEASVRGSLISIGGVTGTLGTFMVFFLGALLPWRLVAFACLIVPFLNICVAFFIPEAPAWLVSKNRVADARKSLRCLRGGVSSEDLSTELEALQNVQKMSQMCQSCEQLADQCKHTAPNFWSKCTDLFQLGTLKPFTLIVTMLFFMQFSALFAMRSYIVQVLRAYAIPLDANFCTTILGVIGVFANVFNVVLIRQLGKRRIYLYAQAGNILSGFGLCFYGFKYFPLGWTSLDDDNQLVERTLEHSQQIPIEWSYFALAMFFVMQFCICVGVTSVPYFLLIEVFPFKSRSFCCGLCSALNQIFGFISAKTYYDLERSLSLPGVILFYSILAVIGFIGTYLILPETEHRTLEDIELHYSDDTKPLTDIHIPISAKTRTNANDSSHS